jgi:hypothetical protein
MLRNCRKPVAAILIGAMTAISVPIVPAQAALVGTDRIIEQTEGSARERVAAFLAREDVVAQLEALGISPEEAQSRVAALSDQEISEIAGKLDTLPAGGVLGALIGAALIVFIVLLITDLLGLTHVFGFTNKGSARP